MSFAIGAEVQVSEEESAIILEHFESLIGDIDAIGIFSHNTLIALPMFIPGFGAAWGFFSAYSTGFAFAALKTGTPELISLNPLLLLLTPFGMMELAAYSIAMSRSVLFIERIIKKTSIFAEKKVILIEIGIVVGLLLVGGIIEMWMIEIAQGMEGIA